MSAAEQESSSQGVVGAELLQFQCSTAVVAQGGAEQRTCVLPTVLGSGLFQQRHQACRAKEASGPDIIRGESPE